MSAKSKVLVTCPMPESFMEGLRKLEYEVDYHPQISQEEAESVIHKYHGVVVATSICVDERFLSKAGWLSWVGRAGSGLDNLDIRALDQRGIRYFSSPEGNRDAVAEHALGMLLALMNHIHRADREVRKGMWLREENRGLEIMGRTIAIIGFGNTGSRFARKLSGFGVQILAYDKYKKNYAPDYVRETDMETIFREAGIVSLHVPLTEETRYMVNREFLNNFQKPVYLLNTSRGPVVNTLDLLDCLDEGQVLGACLDVLETENLKPGQTGHLPWFHRLARHPRIILTPHVAGWTHESFEKISRVLLKKVPPAPSIS